MKKIRAAIIGYGNVGSEVLRCILHSPDFELAGVVRRNAVKPEAELQDVIVTDDIGKLQTVDIAILCQPSRLVPNASAELSKQGYSTVDSFDIHSEIVSYRKGQHEITKDNRTVSVIAAGWDPGTDSVMRAVFEAMAPQNSMYTNFGPGMSMGHTVAAKAISGVKNALSMTLPAGKGKHDRRVYVELCDGASPDDVSALLKADAYFAHDNTEVVFVEDVSSLIDSTHGVLLECEGVQHGHENPITLEYRMRGCNPALTAQIMVSCARAATKLPSGCYTMIEIPPVALLAGDAEEIVRRLV